MTCLLGREWSRSGKGVDGPIIDRLKPDIIHANDFRMLGVAARAVMRARAKGRDTKLVWDAHEFLPGIKPWNTDPRWHLAQMAHEREYAPYADAVITVSDALADLLVTEHGLATRPTVVMNAPEARERGPKRDRACERHAGWIRDPVAGLQRHGRPATRA